MQKDQGQVEDFPERYIHLGKGWKDDEGMAENHREHKPHKNRMEIGIIKNASKLRTIDQVDESTDC